MSSIDRAYGYIAILETPLSEDEREVMDEKFYEDDSNLGTTYDGHCIYYDFNIDGDYDDIYFCEVGTSEADLSKFEDELTKYQLIIKPNTVKPFNCIYYNGADNPISMLTAEQVMNNYRKK